MVKIILLFLLVFFYSANSSNSHSGRTNSEGCHNQRSNGTYHCHGSKSYSKNNSIPKASNAIKVVDGDTIYIGEKKYRFSGIDSPEIKQTCKKNNELVYCGLIAQRILKEKIGSQQVRCIEEDKPDRYQRILAECFVNNESLSKYMVRAGYAFAFRKYSNQFVPDEEYARNNKFGLWGMVFEFPWDFRKKNN